MSACTFIAADCILNSVSPNKSYSLEIDVDKMKIYDGDADDNFYLRPFLDFAEYTDLNYAVELEWAYYTKGRAMRIIQYVKEALKQTDTVELWHVWLGALAIPEEIPNIKVREVAIDNLTVEMIKDLDSAAIWNSSKNLQPTFFCLKIIN